MHLLAASFTLHLLMSYAPLGSFLSAPSIDVICTVSGHDVTTTCARTLSNPREVLRT